MTNATNAVPYLRAALPGLDAVIPLWPASGSRLTRPADVSHGSRLQPRGATCDTVHHTR